MSYWGEKTLMISTNSSVCEEMPMLYFSEDSLSEFYKEATMISDLYKKLTLEQEVIAEYWDDSPGVSGTPVGHLYDLANSQKKSF
jgi:hypothetical protein